MENKTNLAELRKPFPPESIGKLPKGGVMLDYCGHAAVTDRLLQVDPEWSWEPVGTTELGFPALDSEGNLWIQLTVCGVTRLGVGDGRNMKERIGDAIRNAAMRFGVALDLWAKEELESHVEAPEMKNDKNEKSLKINRYDTEASGWAEEGLSKGSQTVLGSAVKLKGITDKQSIVNVLNNLSHTTYQKIHFTELTESEARELASTIQKTQSEALEMLAGNEE